jgi:hypothetical protein
METSKGCGTCRNGSRWDHQGCALCLAGGSELPHWEPKTNPATPAADTVEAAPAAPDANPKTRFGMAKSPISLVPAGALVHMAEAFRDGAGKYGAANWRVDPVSTSTYLNAALRHMLAWQDGEELAADSGVHHLGHAAACLAILMDAQHAATLIDDRPPRAPTGDLIKRLTKTIV